MKHVKIVFIFVMIFSFVFLSVPVYAVSSPTVKSELTCETDGIADIKAKNKVFYLPAGTSPEAVRVENAGSVYSFAGGKTSPVPENGILDITPGLTKDTYGNPCYRVLFDSVSYTFYFADSVGTVYVETSMGYKYITSSRDNRDDGSRILITGPCGDAEYNDVSAGTISEIKGRGNASFSNEKKPFQIKLSKKTDLFGMGKSKTWILLANYNDASYIRNACAYKIAEALELPYTPKSVFVNLYIDNEYVGLYQLCEKTQIGSNRIEITDLEGLTEDVNGGVDLESLPGASYTPSSSEAGTNLSRFTYKNGIINPDDITGGYLVELDNLYSYKEPCTFSLKTGNTYTVKSPEFASKAQMSYISNLFASFEEALYSSTGYNAKGGYYTDYADLSSLVRLYILEEITQDWDAYNGSNFFYKEKDTDGVTGKIMAGPVWDFDNSWGNINKKPFCSEPEAIWAQGKNQYGSSEWNFGWALMQHSDAKALCAELYPVAARALENMLAPGGYIDALTEELDASAAMDMMRWPVEKRNSTFLYYKSYNDGTVSSAVGYLRNFMTVRTEALYAAFGATPLEKSEETATSATAATTANITTARTTAATTANITTAPTTAATTAVTATAGTYSSSVIATQSGAETETASAGEETGGSSRLAALFGALTGLIGLILILTDKKKRKKS